MSTPSRAAPLVGPLLRATIPRSRITPRQCQRAQMATVSDGAEALEELLRSESESPPTQSQRYQPRIDETILKDLPIPRNVQAAYMRPLRRKPTHGLPVCTLQLRSYSPRNLDFFADFALRAAYFLKLPATGPGPLPKIVERWTVPKSNFVHKKAQENFERITHRRVIQIQDGERDTVQLWLAYLEKRGYHGIGLKANFWEYEELDIGEANGVEGGNEAPKELKEA